MKKIERVLLNVVSKAGEKAAVKTCGADYYFYYYQPKEPAALKKIAKK